MATIKAPFNFVPLSSKVYTPEWASAISQDIPFEDQISGILDFTITAKTPVFVRNGHTKEEAEEARQICKEVEQSAKEQGKPFLAVLKQRLEQSPHEYFLFSRIGEKSFIPGTSIKGAIRNVLEIMSFGKIRVDKNAMFAQRDWDNEDLYTLKKQQREIKCGWLRLEKNTQNKYQYVLINCGKPDRIGQKRIDEYIGGNLFRDNFSQIGRRDLSIEVTLNGKKFDPRSAAYKYELVRGHQLENLSFEEDAEYSNHYGRKAVKVSRNGTIRGTIVLTGQPNLCKWSRPKRMDLSAGKFYEFVFEEVEGEKIIISVDEFNHFKFIYAEQWERIQPLLHSEKGVPVFFRLNQNRIQDLGLAYLYKLPYDNSPYGLLKKGPYTQHSDASLDLAECIFGYVNEEEKLKGRVQFSNAYTEGEEQPLNGGSLVTLSSPKPSYYPIYIKQEGQNGKVNQYKTYNDGILSGWKRYPVKREVTPGSLDNLELDTVLFPLPEGTVFKGKIRFHNLKEVEIGALLSALTFHNSNDCYHQLGQGKPYGYGKVSIHCQFSDPALEERKMEFMMKFEQEISQQLEIDWSSSPEMKELFTMAHHGVLADEVLLEYMHMDTDKTKNEFLNAKQQKEFLELFSKLSKKECSPTSLIREYRKKSQEIAREKEEKDRLLVNQNFEALLEEAQQRCDLVDTYKDKPDEGIKLYEKLLKQISEINYLEKLSSELITRRSDLIGDINNAITLLNSRKKNAVSLMERLKNINNIKTVLGNTKKWGEMNNFSSEDLDYLKEKLSSIYWGLKPREQKDWQNIKKWEELARLIGEEKAKEWLNEILK